MMISLDGISPQDGKIGWDAESASDLLQSIISLNLFLFSGVAASWLWGRFMSFLKP
jgi:hypothetical protein